MLKIKDNIDLKELEKFGFRYDDFGFYKIEIELPYGIQRLYIDTDTNEIDIIGSGGTMLSVLYDLIQAGLVEKVYGIKIKAEE